MWGPPRLGGLGVAFSFLSCRAWTWAGAQSHIPGDPNTILVPLQDWAQGPWGVHRFPVPSTLSTPLPLCVAILLTATL